MSIRLFEDFPPVTTDEWMAAIQKDLKGADFEKKLVSTTLDGITLRPFYRREDLPGPIDGELRGYRKDSNDWNLREEIREPDIAAANAHALRALERGAQELAIYTYPIGPCPRQQSDMQALLDGIYIDAVPIHWISGPLSPHMLAMWWNEIERRGLSPEAIQGTVDLDPVLDRCVGWIQAPLEDWRDTLLTVSAFILQHLPHVGLVTVRGAFIEKAGASLAQELAFTLALFTEYLTAYRDALTTGALRVPNITDPQAALAAIVSRCELRFGVGTNYFLEIAKLRAARVLVRNVLLAFGIQTARPKIHVITTSSNKTLYDPYNNLLRATVEAMAAVIAGVDSLTVAAYDQGYHTPDEFSEHLSRNTETLLKEEAHLTRVVDPLGGSYTLEALTHAYAHRAWGLFRCLEAAGGFVAAWKNGTISSELEVVRAKRARLVSSRRRTIVGTTVYPNLKEQRLGDIQPAPPIRQVRSVTADVMALAAEFAQGADLNAQISDQRVPSTQFDPFRPSWPFENLRLRVERHVALGGKRPIVLLAQLGDPVMRRARSGFCLGFFGAGGYDVREETFATPQEAVQRAEEINADALVLCSSDPEYPALTRGLQTNIPLIVAGYPQESIEELQANGVQHFVHIRQDLLETLERYHTLFGIPPMPLDEPINPNSAQHIAEDATP
ncbi:MAG: methylmalonyl-CoA mutase family protein [Chloroherpetonaceae bacterium]|nr:methylmalonyl-CoA mutase family protein [Chthonomonadaceae bacterium]MDW8207869.1 methylmalonyl-CoA mutase family protein [Chloroherpetonaceae bacterium]